MILLAVFLIADVERDWADVHGAVAAPALGEFLAAVLLAAVAMCEGLFVLLKEIHPTY